MTALVNVAYGQPQPAQQANYAEWEQFVEKLATLLCAQPDATQLIKVNNRTMTAYAHRITLHLQTELFRRTGRLANIEVISSLERTCIGPSYRKQLALGLHWLEQTLHNGIGKLHVTA
jgi:hypothetical protein